MVRQNRVTPEEIVKFLNQTQQFRNKLDDLKSQVNGHSKVVQNTTARNDNANKELDILDLSIKAIQKRAKEFKTNVTKIIEGNIGGALNSTLESLRRSRAAKEVVDDSKGTSFYSVYIYMIKFLNSHCRNSSQGKKDTFIFFFNILVMKTYQGLVAIQKRTKFDIFIFYEIYIGFL